MVVQVSAKKPLEGSPEDAGLEQRPIGARDGHPGAAPRRVLEGEAAPEKRRRALLDAGLFDDVEAQ